jgi:hypothetical protein
MAPPVADVDLEIRGGPPSAKASGSRLNRPLKYSGSLDEYESFNVTSVIGREFLTLQLSDILGDDTKIRDLAIIGLQYIFTLPAWRHVHMKLTRRLIKVSQRGVVFFRNQDIDIEAQKVLGQKLGELTGKPETSKVCLNAKKREAARVTDGISCIGMH